MPDPVAWITADDVQRLVGPTVPFTADAAAQMIVDAANTWAYGKRLEAGYVDDPAVAPNPSVVYGTALYAVALWRERGSTDGFASFDDLASFTPTGGSWATIRRSLGVGRAQVDAAPLDAVRAGRRRWHPSILRTVAR